jgi:hypothetical protein
VISLPVSSLRRFAPRERRWTSRESHPVTLCAKQRSDLSDKPVRTAHRNRTCLVLLVIQVSSLDDSRRVVDYLRIERSADSLSESLG